MPEFGLRFEIVGAVNGVPGVTENPLNRFDVPVGVFTETGRTAPAMGLRITEASAAIAMDIGRLVAVPPPRIVAVTPVPANTIEVTPVRFVPVMVAETVVPCAPELG